MTVLDAQAAAKLLYDEPDESPPRTPGSSPSTSKNLAFGDAARVVYGQSAPAQEPPTSRDLNGISVYGDRDAWRKEIEGRYGADLDAATRLAALGLTTISADPSAERAAIDRGGITPRRFAELVEAGARVQRGTR